MLKNIIVINGVLDLQWLVADEKMQELIAWLNKNGEYFTSECGTNGNVCPKYYAEEEPDISAVYTIKDSNEPKIPNL